MAPAPTQAGDVVSAGAAVFVVLAGLLLLILAGLAWLLFVAWR